MAEQTPNPLAATNRTPPHSMELEQAILAALMSISESFDEIEDISHESHFYAQRHKLIFRAVVHLSRAGNPYDVVMVRDWLESQEKLKDAGGEDYLGKLLSSSPASLFNLTGYARRVRELSVLRELIQAGVHLLNRAYEHGAKESVGDVLATTESEIFSISEAFSNSFSKNGPKLLADVLPGIVETLHERSMSTGNVTGVPTGFEELDNKTLGMQPGDLIVVAARPSMGKTTFAMNLVESALYNNYPVVVFSMEMPTEQIGTRMIASFGGVNMTNLSSGNLNEDEWNRVTTAIAHLDTKPIYIDDSRGIPPNEMRARCRRIAKNHDGKLGLVMIDYLQLMTVPGLDPNNRVGMISEISRSLKVLAQEMQCPVVALSQLSRNLESRPDKRPIMSDLRESGAIEQDADVIMFIYRDEYYKKEDSKEKGIAQIIIGKQRNGPTGTVRLAFEPHFLRFRNLDPALMQQFSGLDDE